MSMLGSSRNRLNVQIAIALLGTAPTLDNVIVIKASDYELADCPALKKCKADDGRHTWAETRKRHNRGRR